MSSLSVLCGLLEARHNQDLSLSESFSQAQEFARLPNDGDASYLLLRKVSQDLLMQIEHDGSQRAQSNTEPAYHSRQHIADAVISMGYFLRELELSAYEKQRLLLAMLVHDFGHRGIANRLAELSHEEESIDLLKATSFMSLPAEDIVFVQQCILGTQSSNVSSVSEEHLQNPLDLFAFKRALVNDADIAASFVPSLGLELSKRILFEKGEKNPSQEEVSKALNAFKSNARISTLVARKALGLAEN
jgi:hypothetical protein